tara:strand:- start:593 stop:907 length:315 start_codon:yes stop_codon:yes gene_type:complete
MASLQQPEHAVLELRLWGSECPRTGGEGTVEGAVHGMSAEQSPLFPIGGPCRMRKRDSESESESWVREMGDTGEKRGLTCETQADDMDKAIEISGALFYFFEMK